MVTLKLFLASSSELEADRREFEIFINRKNKEWLVRGIFIELVLWEDFLDAVGQNGLQDEYNKAIRNCDLFVMLFCTKVGRYTEEEFETAFGQFKITNKPLIFTYFRDAEISLGKTDEDDLMSLLAFKKKLSALGHYYTRYKNKDELKLSFNGQLEKLATNGFLKLHPDGGDDASRTGASSHAHLTGIGAIAEGPGANAVGPGGVLVSGNNVGRINSGHQETIDTGGAAFVGGNVKVGGDFVGRDKITVGTPSDDLEAIFASLRAAVVEMASLERRTEATQHVEALHTEVSKGKNANDDRIAKIAEDLVTMVPDAIGKIVSLFATPILGSIVGPVTKYVLAKLKRDETESEG